MDRRNGQQCGKSGGKRKGEATGIEGAWFHDFLKNLDENEKKNRSFTLAFFKPILSRRAEISMIYASFFLNYLPIDGQV
jgi:hypothetical protein